MITVDKIKFGNALKSRRSEQGKTQRECAKACDVSMESYQKWERGLCYPKKEKLKLICDFLSLPYHIGMKE